MQCLLTAGGKVQAGTNRGLWQFDSAANAWNAWDQSDKPRLAIGLKQVTLPDPNGQPRTIGLVQTPRQILWADVNHPDWKGCASAHDRLDHQHRGHCQHHALHRHAVWRRLAGGADVGERGDCTRAEGRREPQIGPWRHGECVYCGSWTWGLRLGAATTNGAFEYDLAPAGVPGWTSLLLPTPLLVTALLRAGNDLVAGTAGGGYWCVPPSRQG
ncbi:MAG: hypothetical protein HZY76_15145 [Anaerolineae bacterium]|nr:MAG: hypothetical protein HZY76_15145 [Anaerolineae bacterium]